MNRETIIAIVVGILLGIGVGFFVLFQTNKNNKAKVIPVAQDSMKKQVTKESSSQGQSLLQVISPTTGTVVTANSITIKGKAPKKSLIVIQSPVSNTVIKTDKEDFSVKFPVALGENVINVSSYSASSTPQETTLTIYYVQE